MVNLSTVHRLPFPTNSALYRALSGRYWPRFTTLALLSTVVFTVSISVSLAQQTPSRRGGSSRRPTAPDTTKRQTPPKSTSSVNAQRVEAARLAQERADSIRALRNANRRPTVNWPDRYATRFSERPPRSPYILRDPKGVSTEFRLDPNGQMGVYERVRPGVSLSSPSTPAPATPITTPPNNNRVATAPPTPGVNTEQNGLYLRPAETIPYATYNRLQNERAQESLLREFSARQDGKSALSGRGLIPKLELPPIVDRIFGGNQVDFKPNGFVTLDFGYLHQFIDNPVLPVQFRRTGNFIFNEQININFNGKIGERLGVMANYDTKSSFNFENALKVNYKPQGLLPNMPNMPNGLNGLNKPSLPGMPGMNSTGLSQPGMPGIPDFTPTNESIIQGLEAGNINWNINSQLIPGVQNLFGAKAQLRFGRLMATLVASQQRSKKQEITLRNGSIGKQYEIRADQYDENRHFFLSQYFRDQYERSLRYIPQITSGVTITRVEVYVTNRTNTTESLRNIAGFSDLGEGSKFNNPGNSSLQPLRTGAPVNNGTNGLYERLRTNDPLRQVDQTSNVVESSFGMQKGRDYDLLRGAKRLTDREFKFHPQLGYISLLTPLRNDEILAVSYEYTYQGQRYQVGELTENYQNRKDDEVLVLKLLKSATIRNNLQLPMWDLMMKNIYSLNTTQITKQNFQLRLIYKDDLTGMDVPNLQEGENLRNRPLVQVFNMDVLNQMQDRQPDGNFDYVEDVTVDSRFGRVIFPVLEPFGSYLSGKFLPSEEDLKAKYVFNELYRKTLADAQQLPDKNKFFIRGSFQSSTGQVVQLPFGVKSASIQVVAGNVPLSPGQDYQFDESSGTLRLMNDGVLNSGRDVRISYELPDMFQNQIRTLVGTHLDYALSPDVTFGLTAMKMKETPAGFLTRVAIGNEPVNNTMLGVSANIRKNSAALTRFMDWLPFIQTKEMSNIQFQGEVAQLIPGVAPRVNNNSFIDDFEATRTIFDLTRQPTRWRLGSTPQQFPQGTPNDPLPYAYNRARISVYTVDQTIYNENANIRDASVNLTEAEKQNYYERYYLPTTLFPGRSVPTVQQPANVLDVAYIPEERGMYNYNRDLTFDGKLKNPRQNFGAIMRAVTSDNDFDNINVENLTFWMLDPFIDGNNGKVRAYADDTKNKNNTTGGKLIFNLGDVSEDVVKDSRYNFENGLPISDDPNDRNNISGVDSTAWGKVTRQQFVTNAFTNQAGARERQDVGLDGLGNAAERAYFRDFIAAVRQRVTDPAALSAILNDPSNDDFQFYLGEEANQAKYIVSRYKKYMGMENNSPENSATDQLLTPANNNLPDIEDLNTDNTINDNEAYYEYEIDLRKGGLQVGKGYITDKVVTDGATWYQFRIPVREFMRKIGSINGFKSIRFMRMYLTDFAEPVVLRFAQLQLEANQYRKYTGDLNQRGLQEVPEPYDAQFKVTTVNIEENSQTVVDPANPNPKFTYVVPPGFQRDRDYTNIANVELNEQSMALSVKNLRDGDARGAFKITNLNMLFRQRLKMFIHMHGEDANGTAADGQVSAFIRIGTDYLQNYYEIEIPKLKATPANAQADTEIWPSVNELDVDLKALVNAKADRDKNYGRTSGLPFTAIYSNPDNLKDYPITVVGNPDLSSVQSIMIGVRNPKSPDELPKTFTIWVNELRTNGYDQTGGTAAVGTLNAKLADFATVQASGKLSTFGFGGVQTKIGDRSQETSMEFGISSSIAVDKLFPQNWGLRIPMYVNYDMRRVIPHFNPLDPDMPLDQALSTLPESERDAYRRMVEDNNYRKGINLSNVRKVKTSTNAKAHFYDIENFSFNYAFNEGRRQNILMQEYFQRQYRGGFAYNYTPRPVSWEPFKNVPSLERKYLFWLKDLNLSLLPTVVSFRTDLDRSFIKTQYRSSDLTTNGVSPQFEKYFLFNRYYDLSWALTKSINITYKAQANAIIDEPYGAINTEVKRDSMLRSLKQLGRLKNYQQELRATYRLPLDKIPLTDWMSADVTYNVGYQFQGNSYALADSAGNLFGNIVRNNRERGISGRVDLVRLYNKLRYLRFANTPSPIRKNFSRSPGDDEEIQRSESKILKSATRLLMTIRGINYSYTIQESTLLPGFLPTPRFFGMAEGSLAPGLPFVLGSQDRNIQYKAADRGWISKSVEQNTAFQQTIGKRFTASTNLEPFKDFRMTINMNLTRTDSYEERFRPGANGQYESQSPVRNGQFSMSFWSFRTAFDPIRKDNSSPIFERFEGFREIILNRLKQINTSAGEYNKNSQDVLIPAFFAAYSGQSPMKTSTSPFYNFPLPNWRVDYNGLSNLKPFKKLFSSFVLAHSYTSTYSVGNYISSLDYGAQYVNLAVMGYNLANQVNLDGQYVPIFIMSTITMSEKFAPLIGIQFQTKNKITGGLEYNKSRDVALNLSNSQVADLNNQDITARIGFTRSNFRVPFKINGGYKRLKNDLTFSCNLTFRDTRAIQRKLDAEHIITSGNINFQLRPQVSYVVNKRLNLNFYFDRTFNNPLVSNSFIRATTAGGVQVRFNLAE